MGRSDGAGEAAHFVTQSKIYGTTQTVLLVGFAAVYFLAPRKPLFSPESTQIVGGVLCLAAVALMLFAIVTLRSVIQIEPQPREGGALISNGPYRWLRHPIYTAIVVAVIGLFLKLPTLPVALASAVVVAYLAVKARYEERLLAAAYPEYQQYKAQTFGVFPFLRG